jgi:tetratricopeptide (TPR) repeat protein
VMRKHYRWAFFLLLVATVSANVGKLVVHGQGQAGGGTLSGEAVGGAALIFRKPNNPTVRVGGGTSGPAAGGGRGSTGKRSHQTAAQNKIAVHEQVIAKANAARSAPTPRYSEAEQQYKLAAQQEPSDARAQFGLGNVFLDQGRFAEAAEAYRQAIKLNADYLPAYQPLSYSLAKLSRYPEAIETLKQALERDPNNAELYDNLGFAYVHAERYSDAVPASQQAIVLLGQSGEAYRQGLQNRKEVLSNAYKNLGNAYNGLKQYNEAAEALKHATEIEPTNAAAHFNLGLALYNGRRYSEAIEAYKAVVKLRPELAAAHYNLGLTYVAINDKAAARHEYDILKPLNATMAAQLNSVLR